MGPSDRSSLDGAGPGAARVIRRKITPPLLPPSVVRRPRVESLLARLIENHRIVCAFASAGAGKTTAVLQAAAQLDRPLAWLSMDATDAAPGRLVVYLEAALAACDPAVVGVGTAALAAKIPHAEAAGLLAEAVEDVPLLLVIDDAERIAHAPEAVAVLHSVAKYLPDVARLVLISRQELPINLGGMGAVPWTGAVGEEDLAFTVDEAMQALDASGRTDIDPVEAIIETGGWVTGVMFEAWRSADHVIGSGGEADPLHGYLSLQILDQLDPAEREFLITTSVLPEVTPAAAEALGAQDATVLLHRLRSRRLPVSWEQDAVAMRCHPRFREYLVQLLARRGEQALRAVHLGNACLLAKEGHLEEAAEEFFTAGHPEGALPFVYPVLERVIERTDFPVAERWLRELAPVRDAAQPELVEAELMLALSREDYGAGIEVADALLRSGRREEVAGRSSRAASLMAWCYLHAGRIEDIRQLLAVADPSPDMDALRHSLRVADDRLADEFPGSGALTGGPLDALVLRADYDLGRLKSLMTIPESPWVVRAAEPWRIGALFATGHLDQAFELYQAVALSGDSGVWLSAVLGPRLMAEVGEADAAWSLLTEGRARIAASGSRMFALLGMLTEAELELILHDDPAAARRVLDRIREDDVSHSFAFVNEPALMLSGLAHLLEGDDRAARDDLAAAVKGMTEGHRRLHLPAAAVFLAEAEWRCGNEDAADAAADLALRSAEEQGSNHVLLDALARFPAVLSRRLDLERRADTPWHGLGRALMVRGVEVGDVLSAAVHGIEFGRRAVLVNGEEVKISLTKSFELLVFLANRSRQEATRQELLEALFDARADESAASYLRQATLRLRKILPDSLEVDRATGLVRLNGRMRVTTESAQLIHLLGQATSLRGADRLRTLLAAFEIADRGTYLSGMRSPWIDERRLYLARLVRDGRLEAAELAFAEGHLKQAGRLAAEVLRQDPFRETAWRLQMRVAHAVGDHDRIVAAYRDCERTLAEIGAEPSSATSQLLADLRP
ncbi:BTAD domain-containing putative transcriptional regulator [Nocardioides aquiterrae]|uniref:Bacterial transcriptional activator domain-containing protein n=1 Tax=Nocardioides aquiterrae TaxID=203799 RepID=A0ABN1UE41_9ACTN